MCILNRVAPKAASAITLRALKTAHASSTPAMAMQTMARRMMHNSTPIRASVAAASPLGPSSSSQTDDASIPIPPSIISEQSRAAYIKKFKQQQQPQTGSTAAAVRGATAKSNTNNTNTNEKSSFASHFMRHYWDPATIPLIAVFGASCAYIVLIGIRHLSAPDVHLNKFDRSQTIQHANVDASTGASLDREFTNNILRRKMVAYDQHLEKQTQNYINSDKTQQKQ